MKVVYQRVRKAHVEVGGEIVGHIGRGACLLVGVEKGDTEEEAQFLAKKIVELRVFPDREGKMNLSLSNVQGEILVVSQFTLAGSVQKGRRPSFDKAEQPARAEKLVEYFVEVLRKTGARVETGAFGALMEVHLVNEGPVTFILESKPSD